jgi:hypothetical protein
MCFWACTFFYHGAWDDTHMFSCNIFFVLCNILFEFMPIIFKR